MRVPSRTGRASGGLGPGERDLEGRALPPPGSDRDRSVHGLHQRRRDGQAEPDAGWRSMWRVAPTIEPTEDVGEVLGRDADPRVRDLEDHARSSGTSGQTEIRIRP